MDSTRNGPTRGADHDARSLREAARDAARRAAGNPEVEKLIADVEELINQLGDSRDPAVASLCTRVAGAVDNARRALNDRAAQVQRRARAAFAAGDSYVHEQPWEALGAAAVAGLVVGLLLFRR
jgi:ElaB/YqjD/DUF883 family membrane-anchored ribosome-binding protein